MSDPAAPPPRPALSDTTPAPIVPTEPNPPRPVRICRSLWLVSATAGFITVLFGLTRFDAIVTRFADALAESGSGEEAPEALRALAMTSVVAALGAILILTVLQLVWMRRLLARRRWARTAQTLTFALQVPAGLVAASVIGPPGSGAWLDRGLILGQLVLAGLALLVGLTRGVRTWLRAAQR